MKIRNLMTILLLILILGCKQKKVNPISDSNSKIEIEHKSKKSDSIFKDITELDEYKDFQMISAEVLDNTDKVLVYLQKDSLHVLILKKTIRNSTPKPNFSFLDKVQLISDKSILYSEPTRCELIENQNGEIIFGFAENEEKEYFDKVLKTWIIDLDKNKFKEIEPDKVKCFNQFYGYDG